MEEKAAEKVAAPRRRAEDLDVTYCSEHPSPPGVAATVVAAVAGDLDVTYCSEHPYLPGAAVLAGMAVGSGICAFYPQEKLGMLVSSSKSIPFHPPAFLRHPDHPFVIQARL